MTRSPSDLIPERPPAYGQETAQVILDIIREFPDLHDQTTWGFADSCNTPHCIAGWAKVVHHAQLGWVTARHAGQEALDLKYQDACNLFGCNNERALHALEYLAKGDPIDWQEIYRTDV